MSAFAADEGADPSPRGSGLLLIVSVASIAYALISMCGGITSFTLAAFGPVLLGAGGERPPAPPLELRWHAALEAIFCFALSVMLLIAGFGTARRMRRAALMLALWSISSIFVHAVFMSWWLTLADEDRAYRDLRAAAEMHAIQEGPAPIPFGEFQRPFEWTHDSAKALRTIPFAYPALVGLVLLLPASRRRIASWN